MSSLDAEGSEDEFGEDLCTQHDTVATLPLNRSRQIRSSSTDQVNHSYVTQPTQRFPSPSFGRTSTPPTQRFSSPSVQVAASSPRASPTPARPLGGILAHSMAPPGTAFRPIPYWISQAQSQSASQSQRGRSMTAECDRDTVTVDSSDEETQLPKPVKTVFTRNGVPISGARAQAQAQAQELSSPARVAESPQPKTQFGRFSYQGAPSVPQKRIASDAMASAYGTSRAPKEQRQTGPAKALPVAEKEMTLDDIKDWSVRANIENLQAVLNCTVNEAFQGLSRSYFNYEDAINRVAEMLEAKEKQAKRGSAIDLTASDDELQQQPRERKQPGTRMPVAKRGVSNVKTIQEKYGGQQITQPRPIAPHSQPHSDEPIPAQPKKKRLVRPPKPPSPAPSSPVQPTKTTTPKPKVEEIDEGIVVSSGDESEAEAFDHEAAASLENELLAFLNKCTAPELIEMSTQSTDTVDQVLAKRPFRSLDAVRAIVVEQKSVTKKGNEKITKKKIGDRLVEVSLEMFASYRTVDNLVTECSNLGRPIREEMRRFGFDTNNQDGEMGTLEFDHDSGIGTPSSTASLDGEDGPKPLRTHLRQPKMMSKDMTMKDYQEVGMNWLALLYSKKMSGILADDMGLGKTCQVIAFLAHLCESGKSTGTHLVIVPGSTLENWLREFQNFCPALNVRPYYGNQNEREELQYQLEQEIGDGNVNVIVTTYDMATSPRDNKFLRRLKPNVVVYDEGHALKNSQSKRYKQLMRIDAQFRLLLTGTPLQNNLQELMSLLAFIMPDMFTDHEEELVLLFKHKAKTTDNDHAALLSKERVDRARQMMTPFILRRKKHQVLKHLPTKTVRTEYCNLTPAQRSVYESEAAKARKVLRESGSEASKAKANVMMKLRQAAIHPLLFRRHFTDGKLRQMAKAWMRIMDDPKKVAEYVMEDLTVMTDFELNRFCDQYPRQMSKFKFGRDAYLDSGKVAKLVDILRKHKENGDRTLVFSQFTMVMDVLEEAFEIEQISFSRLDGGTKMAERQDLIDQYYADESIQVFMLSTGAGGAGINLACANKVIIFDSSFNPHQDAQAENRAHRVGQTREVEVIKLVTKDTIEEQIQALGRTKLALDERVAGEAGGGDDTKADDRAAAEGMQLVENMMLNEPLKEESSDIKDDFMKGLKDAGVKLAE